MSKKSTQASRADRAAAAVHAQQRAERRRRNRMVGGVVLVLLLVVVGGTLWVRAADPTGDVAAPAAGEGGGQGLAIGDPDAPHEVVVYEDFLCPFCAELEGASRDRLDQLAEDGRVYVEYRPFVLLDRFGDYSERATNAFAVVLEESGPEVAKRYHDLLFDHQPEEGGPYPGDDELVELAVQAGADEDAVRPGIEGGEQADWVAAATAAAEDAGVLGTPTVLLDGEVYQKGSTPQELADSLVADLE